MASEIRPKMLRYIRDFAGKYGYPPSVREIMRYFGFHSPRAVSFHLERLEAEGLIERHGKARGLRLKKFLPDEAIELPIYGFVPSSKPGQTSQPLGNLVIHPSLVSKGAARHAYGLRVKGNGMAGAKIHDGDVAIVEQRAAKNNDVVVAKVDGVTSVRRLVQKGTKVYLKSDDHPISDTLSSPFAPT